MEVESMISDALNIRKDSWQTANIVSLTKPIWICKQRDSRIDVTVTGVATFVQKWTAHKVTVSQPAKRDWDIASSKWHFISSSLDALNLQKWSRGLDWQASLLVWRILTVRCKWVKDSWPLMAYVRPHKISMDWWLSYLAINSSRPMDFGILFQALRLSLVAPTKFPIPALMYNLPWRPYPIICFRIE